MSRSIDISETHKEIVQAILREHLTTTCHVWVFGSRATWLAKAYSDLDLAIARKDGTALSLTVMSAIETAFEDSLLPWKVDVIDLNSVSEEFRAAIERDKVLFSLGVGGGWKTVSLESIVSFSQGLQVPVEEQFSNFIDGRSQFIRIVDFTNIAESPRYIKTPSKKYFIETDDIVMIRYGSQTAGKVVRGKSGVLANNMFKITVNTKSVVKGYLFHYLTSPSILNFLINTQSSSTMPAISFGMLKPIRISFPSKTEQQRIADFIDRLDDKIELNRQTNQTLEAMAQALFQSWFVDFDPVIDKALAAGNEIPEAFQAKAAARQALGDQRLALPEEVTALFPDAFVFTEEMGWVPEGWEVRTVGDEIKNTGGGTPSTKVLSYWENGRHAFCTPKDMSGLGSIVLTDTERHLTDVGINKISSGLLSPGVVLMSSRAPIGYLAISDIPVSINQGIIAMLPNKKYGSMYLVNWARFNMQSITERANGSTFLEISKKNFRPIPFLVPSELILFFYNTQAQVIYDRLLIGTQQIRELTTLRDTLLPKLISGELRVENMEVV